MPSIKGTEHIANLLGSLQRTLMELEAGKLDLAGLDEATDSARALYERLVVLRHKARELSAHAMAPEPPSPERASMRLDTRPPDVSLRQTSLIDAIAEAEPGAPKATAPNPPSKSAHPTDRPGSLAERLEHAPVTDLSKAITLSQKFWFVAELFGGERDRYERAVQAINGAADLEAARSIVEKDVIGVLPKAPGEDVREAFLELVQRRFQ